MTGVGRRDQARSLSHSVKDGCAQALMLGMGEAYLAPFAIYLGANNLIIGVLAAAPLLAGSLAQLWVASALDRATSRRAYSVVPAVIQALAFVPLFALPRLMPGAGPELLVAAALLYYVAGSIGVPPWNSWIADLVEPSERGDYFGYRNKLKTIFQIGGVAAAGLCLAFARRTGQEALGFAAIFAVSLAARLVSAWQMNAMAEPAYVPPARADAFSFTDFVRRAPAGNFGRFTIYVALLLAATNIAGPFFTPYMLSDLHFTYVQFTLASTAFVVSQAVTMHNWGKLADRFGNRRVVAACGIALPIIPLLWLLSTSLIAIVAFQIVSGVLWAGFYLGVANFLFDAVTPAKRARCVAYYNTLTNLGLFVGALLGGFIAHHLPDAIVVFGWKAPLASKLQLLFLISGVARLLVSVALLPAFREVRDVEPSSSLGVIVQIIGMQPIRGVRIGVFSGVRSRRPPSG